jgi:hypothetical protein
VPIPIDILARFTVPTLRMDRINTAIKSVLGFVNVGRFSNNSQAKLLNLPVAIVNYVLIFTKSNVYAWLLIFLSCAKKKQLEQTGTYKFMFQEKIEIHGKPAIIFGFRLGEYSGKRKDVYKEVWGHENLEVYIEHKNQLVTVKFECSGNICSDYIKESRKLTDVITFEE